MVHPPNRLDMTPDTRTAPQSQEIKGHYLQVLADVPLMPFKNEIRISKIRNDPNQAGPYPGWTIGEKSVRPVTSSELRQH